MIESTACASGHAHPDSALAQGRRPPTRRTGVLGASTRTACRRSSARPATPGHPIWSSLSQIIHPYLSSMYTYTVATRGSVSTGSMADCNGTILLASSPRTFKAPGQTDPYLVDPKAQLPSSTCSNAVSPASRSLTASSAQPMVDSAERLHRVTPR